MSKEITWPWVCDDCGKSVESVRIDPQGKKHCGCIDTTKPKGGAWSGPFLKEHPEVQKKP